MRTASPNKVLRSSGGSTMHKSEEHIVFYKMINLISLHNDFIVNISCVKQSKVVIVNRAFQWPVATKFTQLRPIRP